LHRESVKTMQFFSLFKFFHSFNFPFLDSFSFADNAILC